MDNLVFRCEILKLIKSAIKESPKATNETIFDKLNRLEFKFINKIIVQIFMCQFFQFSTLLQTPFAAHSF